jgi:hypothetical protein
MAEPYSEFEDHTLVEKHPLWVGSGVFPHPWYNFRFGALATPANHRLS